MDKYIKTVVSVLVQVEVEHTDRNEEVESLALDTLSGYSIGGAHIKHGAYSTKMLTKQIIKE